MVNVMTVRDYIGICLVAVAFIHECYGGDLCPPGWIWSKGKFRCMKVMNTDLRNYNEAIDGCESIGGELIRIEDYTDQADVDCLISKEPMIWGYWIQMTSNSGKWQFENGDTVTWFNWRYDQPNEVGIQNCITLEQSSLKWHDQYCNLSPLILHYICTKKSGNGSFVETNFKKEPSRCLVKHSLLQRYPSSDKVASMECLSSCSADKCCSAAAVSADECLHYIANRTAVTPECVDQTYEMFTEQ